MRFRTIAAGLVIVVPVAAALAFWAVRRELPPAVDATASAEARVPPAMTFRPVFAPCAHCHEVGTGARTSSGPVLNGIVGRAAASREDYPYSQALADSGIVWTRDNLSRFLQSPGAVVPGTRMMVGGFTEDQIGPIIDFLKQTPAP